VKKLALAKDLALPADEAVTQKYGFIGRSGSGKSYASMKLAELFLGAGAQIIALDWVGIWWSLRLAANGKAPGFEHVYIFGGEHADVELRPESGALMADLIVDKHISVVLDVMHFRKAERTRFATAFAEQFFHRKKTARTACHLFIEEAQAYLPQMVRGDEARMVGVFEDIGKVGRNYGIGTSLISQRPQAINKDVLNQVEVLLAFQTNGPQERKAIAGWTAENTSAGAAMIQQLPALKVGHAQVWSPQWLRLAQEVHIAERDTYNASSTPTQNAKTIAPQRMTPAELEDLGEAVKQTIEKAKADDPKELHKKVAELTRTLEKERIEHGKALSTDGKPASAHKAAPALTDADRSLIEKLTKQLSDLQNELWGDAVQLNVVMQTDLENLLKRTWYQFEGIHQKARKDFLETFEKSSVKKLLEKLNGLAIAPVPGSRLPVPPAPRRDPAESALRHLQRATGGAQVPRSPGPKPEGTGDLAKGEHVVLTAIAQHGDAGCTREQITVLTGYKKSTRDLYLQQLGRRGAINAGAIITATPEGVKLLGPGFAPLPTGTELRQHWLNTLPLGERRVLEEAIGAYPNSISRDDLTEKTEYKKSTRDLYVQLLQRRKLVTTDRAGVRASDMLFD
jgi:uncharacterized protein